MRSKHNSLVAAQKTSCSKKTPSQPPSSQPAQNAADDLDWRRNGNVARLPKPLRDKINSMILDGVPYPAIIQSLGEDGKHLNGVNLTRWRKGGYKDWLAEQAFIERTRARQETPAELVRDFDATEVNHAALQLGTLHIFEALRDLGPGSLNQKLGGDCAAFARLINALARASRETMQLQRYRDVCARARRMLEQLKDPKRKLTDDERRSIVLQVDDILGLGAEPQPLELQSPIPEPQNPSILRSSATAEDGITQFQGPDPELQTAGSELQTPQKQIQNQDPEILNHNS